MSRNFIKVQKETTNEIIKKLEKENADLLLDSAMKDYKISILESDLADLTLEVAMLGVSK